MINRQSKAYQKILSALETVFLALAGIFLVYRVSRSTMFHLNWPSNFESYLLYGLTFVALARLLAMGLRRRETLGAVALTLVYLAVYRVSGFSFLLFLAAFTVGFTGIEYRKILRVYLLTVGLFYLLVIPAGQMGVITNLVYASVGRGMRSAWGMSYYTDFASLGLFILMWFWVYCRRLPAWAMLALCALYLLLSVFIARSITSTFCGALLICAILYCAVEGRLRKGRPGLRWIGKAPGFWAMYGFPLLALVMFALMLLYARGSGMAYRLNTLLSNRLRLSVAAWRNYGLKPFGTPFAQNGFGFSTFPSNSYNFVDSTYPLVLLRYGWVTFIALCLSWGITARRVWRGGDRRLLLVMGIIAVHAFAEHHFIDSHFNILVAMPLAAFPPVAAEIPGIAEGKKGGAARAVGLAWTITGLLLAIGAILLGPSLLSRLKTALELLHYGHGEHALRLIFVIAALLCGLCLAAWATSRLIRALLARAGMRGCIPAVAALLACAVMGAGAWLFTDKLMDRAAAQSADRIESDRRALEIATGAATGKVYSGVLPELYNREIDGMARAAFFEDDMARLRGDTVLMGADAEHGVFFDNGFLYVPISGGHALYTGDRAVAEALAGAGYRCTGYYSDTREIALESAADLNGLAWNPATGLRLSDEAGGMRQGPWQDLYGGSYTATWALSLPEGAGRPEGKLCTLRITAYRGENVVAERTVQADEFDARGHLTLSMPFEIKDSRNVGFEAWTQAGATVDIQRISFVRTPKYDVHTFYDDRLRKTRSEYYGPDGKPTLQEDGWFACDFGYDRYGNIDRVRYYDRDGAPTASTDGYAERRRTFDARKKVVREEYYDAEGRPVDSAQGYAAVEYDYDADGQAVKERYYDQSGKLIEERTVG